MLKIRTHKPTSAAALFSALRLNNIVSMLLVVGGCAVEPRPAESEVLCRDAADAGYRQLEIPSAKEVYSREVIATDLDGDLAKDVLIFYQGQTTELHVFRAPHSGDFSNPQRISVARNATAFKVHDLDGDGRQELLISSGLTSAERFKVDIYKQQGDGRFALVHSLNTDVPLSTFDAGDVDGDGFVDLLLGLRRTGETDPAIRVYRARSSLRYEVRETVPLGFAPHFTHSGKLNDDKRTDFVVRDADMRETPSVIYWGQADGGLVRHTAVKQLSQVATGFFADVNADGRKDWVADCVYTSDGVGVFNDEGLCSDYATVHATQVVSVTQDETNAIIQLHRIAADRSAVLALKWNRDRLETQIQPLCIQGNALWVAAADLNDDRRTDFVVTGNESDRVFLSAQ